MEIATTERRMMMRTDSSLPFLSFLAITKNGITKLAGPPALDLSKVKSDKKITDEEILKILEQPLSRNTGKKSKSKKKKPAKKEAAAEDSGDDE